MLKLVLVCKQRGSLQNQICQDKRERAEKGKRKKKRPFLPPAQTKKVRARSEPLPATRQSALRSEDDSFSLLPTNSLEDRGGAGSSAAGSVVSQVSAFEAKKWSTVQLLYVLQHSGLTQ